MLAYGFIAYECDPIDSPFEKFVYAMDALSQLEQQSHFLKALRNQTLIKRQKSPEASDFYT